MNEQKDLGSEVIEIKELTMCARDTVEKRDHLNTEGTIFHELTLLNLVIDRMDDLIKRVIDIDRYLPDRKSDEDRQDKND